MIGACVRRQHGRSRKERVIVGARRKITRFAVCTPERDGAVCLNGTPGLNNGVLLNIRCDARKCNQNPYHPLQCNTCKRLYLLCTFSDNTSPGRRRFYSFLQ